MYRNTKGYLRFGLLTWHLDRNDSNLGPESYFNITGLPWTQGMKGNKSDKENRPGFRGTHQEFTVLKRIYFNILFKVAC